MNPAQAPNINHLWGMLIIEELRRNGVEYFCVSPGSRSAPLIVPLGLNSKVKTMVHFDERGAAFHALGFVSATGKPAAIISTSGTAAANFLPAVIEASKKKLPLIVLTADRPPELRKSGADQTIEQVGLFGEYVRWQFDMPCPDEQIDPQFVLTTIDQAVHRSCGNPRGPVHLNCMFREPLAPITTNSKFTTYLKDLNRWEKSDAPLTTYIRAVSQLKESQLESICSVLKEIKNGVIAVGKLSSTEEREAVLQLAQKLQWPIYSDITSGLKCGYTAQELIRHFNHLLSSEKFCSAHPVDGVLHLGGRITSKRWYQYIAQSRPKHYLMVLNHPLRNDPLHTVSRRIESGIQDFCRAVLPQIAQRPSNSLTATLKKLSDRIENELTVLIKKEKALNEISAIRLISENLTKDTGLFLASSMPIRDFDMFASQTVVAVPIGANRGASGIDGIISTAAGFAVGLQKPVTLVIGDLAFLHDLNALATLRELSVPLVIVVLNNNGGGIFSFLPIAQFKPTFEKFFGTPHGLQFKAAAELFDLKYARPTKSSQFCTHYRQALKSKQTTIIEVTGTRDRNVKIHQEIQKRLQTLIATSLN